MWIWMTPERIVSDERRCFEYLFQQLPAYSCSFCHSSDHYPVSRQRVRCKQCRRDIKPLSGTGFSLLTISCSTRLIILKLLFDLSISARKAAKEAGVELQDCTEGI